MAMNDDLEGIRRKNGDTNQANSLATALLEQIVSPATRRSLAWRGSLTSPARSNG
jgi:hypothetical protein